MTILEDMTSFAQQYGKQVTVNQLPWRYYRLGTGTPILWLTGGLRRAVFGYAFMQRLAIHHTVVAPDYPPAHTIGEFMTALDTILQAENITSVALGCQSYGGLLAQAYLAHNPGMVERLILSSTGPADYGKTWRWVDEAFILLSRLLPEKTLKRLLFGGLLKIVTVPEAERSQWEDAIHAVIQNDLTRADVISHFAVAADLIGKGMITPAAYQHWKGRIIVLSSLNDPTQNPKSDLRHYEKMFGRPAELLDLGEMGHTAALFDPDRYVQLLEQALT
jgi:pimeloyl-ACP methyl ester carboxylesterase